MPDITEDMAARASTASTVDHPGADVFFDMLTGTSDTWRDRFTLAYVDDGRATLSDSTSVWELDTGDAVLCGPDTAYSLTLGPNARVARFVMRPHIVNDGPGVFNQDLGVFADYFLRFAHGIHGQGPIHVPRNDDVASEVHLRVASIAANVDASHAEWTLFASAELTCLLTLLAQGAAVDTEFPSDQHWPVLGRILSYTRDNYQTVTLRHLSELFNYSANHIARLVRRHTGRRFSDLVRDLKIRHAMDYLTSTGLGLEQISHMVGFSSTGYFAHVFHQQVGITPGQYRATTPPRSTGNDPSESAPRAMRRIPADASPPSLHHAPGPMSPSPDGSGPDHVMRDIIRSHSEDNNHAFAADPATYLVSGPKPGEPGHQYELVLMAPDEDRALRFFTQPHTEPGLHRLYVFKLAYVYYGGVTITDSKGQHSLGAGDAFFCDPLVAHRTEYDGDSCVISFIMRPEAALTITSMFVPESGVFGDHFLGYRYGIRTTMPVYLPRDESSADAVRLRYERMSVDLWERHVAWNMYATGEMTGVLSLLASSGSASAGDKASDPSFPLAPILRHITDHCRDVTLQDVADVFHYSPTHVSRVLQRRTGRRFAEIVRDLKIYRTRDYLVTTRLTLEQISTMVGFSSASYLAQVFRAQVGMTPGQYRVRYQKARDLGSSLP
ncbi:MAG: helix-turn-helix transcriptional regulator [Propionibacteriaceae bacterium]|nr:helix-turn-helix transcriptional regulator [Propionibacteriaceae bacterium]